MSQTLTLTITGRPGSSTSAPAPWLRLSQPEVGSALATISDLAAMHNQARAGQPAQKALPTCPGLVELPDGRLQWSTEILVHRSDPELAYTLAASTGSLGSPENRSQPREKSYTFADSDHIDLGTTPGPSLRLQWETPAYDASGRALPLPALRLAGRHLYAPFPFFGVVRIFYNETCQAWPLTLIALDQEEPFACTVSAFWGETGVEKLAVTASDCAQERALSTCRQPSGSGTSTPDDEEEETEPRLHVEYDQCSGAVVRSYYA